MKRLDYDPRDPAFQQRPVLEGFAEGVARRLAEMPTASDYGFPERENTPCRLVDYDPNDCSDATLQAKLRKLREDGETREIVFVEKYRPMTWKEMQAEAECLRDFPTRYQR